MNREYHYVITPNQKGLWNPKIFYWLAVIFSFLPVAVLFSMNWGRLGFPKKRTRSLVIAFLAFGLVVLLGQSLPSIRGLQEGLYFGINVAAAMYMRREQQTLYNNHIKNGSKKASFIVPILISSIAVGIILWAMIYSYNIPDTKLTYNQSDLYYTTSVSIHDAEKLGSYLNDNGFFSNHAMSLKIDKTGGKYILSVPINKSRLNDKEVLSNFSQVSSLLSRQVFDGGQLEIHLTDDRFNNLKTVTGNQN